MSHFPKNEKQKRQRGNIWYTISPEMQRDDSTPGSHTRHENRCYKCDEEKHFSRVAQQYVSTGQREERKRGKSGKGRTSRHHQPNCSQCSSTPDPSDRMQAAVVLRTCAIRPSGPQPSTSTRCSAGVSSIMVRIKEGISGRPRLMKLL